MRSQSLIPLVLATLCLFFLAGCAASSEPAPVAPTRLPPSPTTLSSSPTPAATLDLRMQLAQAFQDGLNRGDGAAVAALFVDQGMGYMDSGYLISDKAEVVDYIDEGGPRHWSLQLSACGAQGTLWHCRAVEREDCMLAGFGKDELRTDMTLTPKDGKIQYIEFAPSAEDLALLESESKNFWTWVQTNRDTEWKAMATPATAPKGRARGELVVKLCKEYVASRN